MKSNDNHNHKVTDMNSKTTTRVLSIDMGQEVVDFLRKENLETYDGTFGPFVELGMLIIAGIDCRVYHHYSVRF